MAVEIRDIPEEMSKLTMLKGRRPDTPHDKMDAFHASLGSINGAAMVVASFQGQSCWECHPMGEELVHIVDGETELTMMTDDGPETVTVTKGQLLVVPPGMWHQFSAPNGVTVMAATPHPSDHYYGDDPRDET
jgi:mannose-6-phosphate isomerase-like protein (cupin superfamily)